MAKIRLMQFLPLCVCVAAAFIPAAKADAQILWLEKDYDFGLMKEVAGPKSGSVRFVNMGKNDVTITGARPSCGCTDVSYSEDPIAPGDTATVSFTYNPLGRPGKFEKSIRVYVGENDTYRIGIRGNVLGTPESLSRMYPVESGPLRLSESRLSAGDVTYGTTRHFFINAYNQSGDSISPVCSGVDPALTVNCSQQRLGPGDIATFSVFFNSGTLKETGPVDMPFVISADAGGNSDAALTVDFKANVTPDFSRLSPEQVDNGPRCYAAPATIDLGDLSSRVTVPFTFRIQNQGKSKLNVSRIYCKDKAVKIKRYPTSVKRDKSGETEGILNMSAIEPGPFNIKIDIHTDDPIHPVRTVSIVGIKEN